MSDIRTKAVGFETDVYLIDKGAGACIPISRDDIAYLRSCAITKTPLDMDRIYTLWQNIQTAGKLLDLPF